MRDVLAEQAAAAKAMVLGMGAAADSAAVMTDKIYAQLPRLQQLCLLGLSGTGATVA